jgi:hypothetical protein
MVMGLDQYAFFGEQTENSMSPKFQWRKHPFLQGFMEALYYSKGGEAEHFNCVDLELTAEDIDSLEKSVKDGSLPTTEGFFFGCDSCYEYKDQDLEFCEAAREAISEGMKVVYSSWW